MKTFYIMALSLVMCSRSFAFIEHIQLTINNVGASDFAGSSGCGYSFESHGTNGSYQVAGPFGFSIPPIAHGSNFVFTVLSSNGGHTYSVFDYFVLFFGTFSSPQMSGYQIGGPDGDVVVVVNIDFHSGLGVGLTGAVVGAYPGGGGGSGSGGGGGGGGGGGVDTNNITGSTNGSVYLMHFRKKDGSAVTRLIRLKHK